MEFQCGNYKKLYILISGKLLYLLAENGAAKVVYMAVLSRKNLISSSCYSFMVSRINEQRKYLYLLYYYSKIAEGKSS